MGDSNLKETNKSFPKSKIESIPPSINIAINNFEAISVFIFLYLNNPNKIIPDKTETTKRLRIVRLEKDLCKETTVLSE